MVSAPLHPRASSQRQIPFFMVASRALCLSGYGDLLSQIRPMFIIGDCYVPLSSFATLAVTGFRKRSAWRKPTAFQDNFWDRYPSLS